jgi:hypothetical protein
MKLLWNVTPEWAGETVFIVAGGPSVAAQNLDVLAGRKVIAVNSSYERAPSADVLFFGDCRWWDEHRDKPALRSFPGRLVTCSQAAVEAPPYTLHRLRRDTPPPGFSADTRAVASQWTSSQGAMNLAAHFGARRIVMLGLDLQRAADGATHHHSPHKWPNKPGNRTWDFQLRTLEMIVEPLRERDIEVINASPASRAPWWDKMALEDAARLPIVSFQKCGRR